MPANRPYRAPKDNYFSSDESFGMIRGGHIDLAILGAMEVAQNGDLANWMIPGKFIKGIRGAMDLMAGVKRVVVIMDHTTRDGSSKLLRRCSLPLTSTAVVDRVITNLGAFDVAHDSLSCGRAVARCDRRRRYIENGRVAQPDNGIGNEGDVARAE